jgi:hypothetical protein
MTVEAWKIDVAPEQWDALVIKEIMVGDYI